MIRADARPGLAHRPGTRTIKSTYEAEFLSESKLNS